MQDDHDVPSGKKQLMHEILEDMWTMSPADLSVLEAALRHESGQMLTTAGSSNDRIWSKMAKLGLMRAVDVAPDLQGGLVAARSYELLEKGRKKVIPAMIELIRFVRTGIELMKVKKQIEQILRSSCRTCSHRMGSLCSSDPMRRFPDTPSRRSRRDTPAIRRPLTMHERGAANRRRNWRNRPRSSAANWRGR